MDCKTEFRQQKADKMAIDNTFMKKRLEKMEHLFVLFSASTHLPFVVCDEETYDDQVYIFGTEEMTQAFAKTYTGKKYPLQAIRISTNMFQNFFASLYQYGITAVVLQDEGAPVRIPLSDLAEPLRPDEEMAKKLPVSNPALQLTAMYFIQEVRRPGKDRDEEEKKQLRSLEEEMAHNLFNSRFIVIYDTSQAGGKGDLKSKTARIGIPLIRTKDGHAFQPVFTDPGEFRRFAARTKDKRKMRLVPVPYADLGRFLSKEAEGFAFNPAGFDLVLSRMQMERLDKLYKDRQ